MKLDNKVKIIGLGVVVLLIVAIIVGCVIGVNKDLMYKAHEEIEIVIGKDFETSDVKKITDEVFKDKYVIIRKVEVFKDAVAIDLEGTTEEELSNLKTKMNEFYGLELEEVKSSPVPSIRIMDIIKPYIIPGAIAMVLMLVYIGFRYKKLEKKGMFIEPISFFLSILFATLAFYSLVVICRIPFSKTIVSISAILAFAVSMVWVNCAEKKLNRNKEEEEK